MTFTSEIVLIKPADNQAMWWSGCSQCCERSAALDTWTLGDKKPCLLHFQHSGGSAMVLTRGLLPLRDDFQHYCLHLQKLFGLQEAVSPSETHMETGSSCLNEALKE